MSVQFGCWNFDGQPSPPATMQEIFLFLAPFGPDGLGTYVNDGTTVFYRSFRTTTNQDGEKQPCLLPTGVALVWDGRLDNRKELVASLDSGVSTNSSDALIVAAAYARWGTDSFARLLGDWAISVWDPVHHTLVLAKDFLGTRPLYYLLESGYSAWCSLLEPLLRTREKPVDIDEEYIAGWLSSFPAASLTPYVGIRSVPPACFVRIRNGRASTTNYWQFDPAKRCILRNDREYEEHFRTLLSQSICRRLRSDFPVIAELSGGMDSSSIVCVADQLLGEGCEATSRLDTISYYDDAEPNWNERPYFTKVEELRGRPGVHINMRAEPKLPAPYDSNCFFPVPGIRSQQSDASLRFSSCLAENQNRVLLSGIGGDEVLGGIPSPVPQLADLLTQGNVRSFGVECARWAIAQRRPLLHLAADLVRAFLTPRLARTSEQAQAFTWLAPRFRERQRRALDGYSQSLRLLRPRPSFQDNIATLEALRRQFGTTVLSSQPRYERRYPYLDRDLLEFLFAIPPEQLQQPGKRRSLMRRALGGIVPHEILNRRRKAYVVRSPIAALANDYGHLCKQEWTVISLGLVNAPAFQNALLAAREGRVLHVVALLRILELEYWLRHLSTSGFVRAASVQNKWHPSVRPEVHVSSRVEVS